MKLRNKKTGELGYLLTSKDNGEYIIIDDHYHTLARYDSLDEFNENWEDYNQADPLIKDEKVRKAVRAWAEANDIEQVQYSYDGNILWFGDNEIDFKYLEPLALELNVYYTITELCGEEEE